MPASRFSLKAVLSRWGRKRPHSPGSCGALGLLVAACLAAAPSPAAAFSPYLVVPDPKVAEATPAYRYANLDDAGAFAELDRRRILYSRVDAVPGVRAPIRLTGRLHGVYIHSALPPEQRVTSVFEILDARLALALDDFAGLLERHGIDEVVHFTMYRPNVAPPAAGADDEPIAGRPSGARPRVQASVKGKAPGLGPKGALDGTKPRPAGGAPRQKAGDVEKPDPGLVLAPPGGKKPGVKSVAPAKAPPGASKRVARRDPPGMGLHNTTWAPPGTRHPAGLAIDVGLLRRRDGRWLSVARQFRGHIGDKTCGEGAHVPEDPDARELHALVCEAAALGLFTYVLTPDFNAAHADHFHMEVKPGVRWFLYH